MKLRIVAKPFIKFGNPIQDRIVGRNDQRRSEIQQFRLQNRVQESNYFKRLPKAHTCNNKNFPKIPSNFFFIPFMP
jgi:hypothetical protein